MKIIRLPGFTAMCAFAAIAFAFASLPACAQEKPQPTAIQPSTVAPAGAAKPATPKTVKSRASSKRQYDRQLAEIRHRGELIVGMSPFVPWSFADPQVGWLGFDVDIARQLAADLGVSLKIVEIPFPRMLEAVRNGDIDIATGVSITPRRALLVAFSQPYSQSQLQLVARKLDASRSDWDSPDVTIGARDGSLSELSAGERFPNAKVVTFDRDSRMFESLDSGKINAALAFAPQPKIRMALEPDSIVIVQDDKLSRTAEGLAVRKGQPSLVNFLNAWITYWQANGWLAARHAEWFDSLDWTARLSRP